MGACRNHLIYQQISITFAEPVSGSITMSIILIPSEGSRGWAVPVIAECPNVCDQKGNPDQNRHYHWGVGHQKVVRRGGTSRGTGRLALGEIATDPACPSPTNRRCLRGATRTRGQLAAAVRALVVHRR